MLRKLLICGLAAGACGGLLATGFVSVAGEPAIDRAVACSYGEFGQKRSRPHAKRGAESPLPLGNRLPLWNDANS